jgi:hypothetical protein
LFHTEDVEMRSAERRALIVLGLTAIIAAIFAAMNKQSTPMQIPGVGGQIAIPGLEQITVRLTTQSGRKCEDVCWVIRRSCLNGSDWKR